LISLLYREAWKYPPKNVHLVIRGFISYHSIP
jgi:hypothetical protein